MFLVKDKAIKDTYKTCSDCWNHGLRTPREEISFTAQPNIQFQSQIFRYGQSIFCLPHRPNFSDILDLCLHWVSVVRGWKNCGIGCLIRCTVNFVNQLFLIMSLVAHPLMCWSWNFKHYVIFVMNFLCLLFTGKINFLHIGQTGKLWPIKLLSSQF